MPNRRLCLSCAFVGWLTLAFVPSTAPLAVAQDDPDGWRAPTPPAKIVGPIHYVGTYGLAVYLITTPAGHILIDGGVPGTGPAIVGSIEAAGFKPADVRILLTTQAHYDHVGTLAFMKQATGGRIIVMKGDEELLASGGSSDYLFGSATAFHFPVIRADEVIGDGHVITLGGVSLTARHTPGHTPGTTTWTTTVEDGGQSYRVVFAGSTYVNSGTRLVKQPSYPGIEADYRRSFALLESLPVDIYLAAHAQSFDFHARRQRAKADGPRAFVDPDAMRQAATASKAAFEKLVAAERLAAATGWPAAIEKAARSRSVWSRQRRAEPIHTGLEHLAAPRHVHRALDNEWQISSERFDDHGGTTARYARRCEEIAQAERRAAIGGHRCRTHDYGRDHSFDEQRHAHGPGQGTRIGHQHIGVPCAGGRRRSRQARGFSFGHDPARRRRR